MKVGLYRERIARKENPRGRTMREVAPRGRGKSARRWHRAQRHFKRFRNFIAAVGWHASLEPRAFDRWLHSVERWRMEHRL